ncbi:hypothetical protein [Kushneria avicenniae]|uniref:hypothetical protein n=1 Tax=Kushneria avicenniae TaxID=402385 RepID=UPI001113784E|nr:hypothetical protein [Kushneria avicenniae]
MLLLAATIVAMGIQYYQDHKRWNARISALTDRAQQVSTDRQEMTTNLDHVLEGIRDEQQNQRSGIESLKQQFDQQANGNELEARLSQLEEADALRQQTLGSLQQSLDSLDDVIKGLESTYGARFEDLDNTNAEQAKQLQQIDKNSEQLKSLADSVADQRKTLDSVETQASDLTKQIERLQKAQTGLHATLESLQDILNP